MSGYNIRKMSGKGSLNEGFLGIGITEWLIIIGFSLIVIAVLVSIQMITCNPSFPGGCVKPFCFHGWGICG